MNKNHPQFMNVIDIICSLFIIILIITIMVANYWG